MKILYFVSGHGFGHISRSSVIINALLKKKHTVILVSTRLKFVEDYTHPELIKIDLGFDIGISQKSSLDIDLQETCRQAEIHMNNQRELQSSIASLCSKYQPDKLISDCSPLPFHTAAKLNIPSLFIGNFTWDFIYQHYENKDARFKELANLYKDYYGHCNLALTLPFSCPMDSLPNSRAVGLVGRRSEYSRDQARQKLGFEQDKQYVLFSFGAYGLDIRKLDFDSLPANMILVFTEKQPIQQKSNVKIIETNFTDTLQACDAVLTKPGYGIMAECHFSNTALLYTDRGDFIEYPYLVAALKKYHRATYIEQSLLFSLQFQKSWDLIEQMNNEPIEQLKDGLFDVVKEIES